MRLGWKVVPCFCWGGLCSWPFMAKFELFGGAYARWAIGG